MYRKYFGLTNLPFKTTPDISVFYKHGSRQEILDALLYTIISGGMDNALKNVSYFYDREAKELIDKIEPAIEPILTVVMGFVVGWVMIAVLGPIYDTIAQVQ